MFLLDMASPEKNLAPGLKPADVEDVRDVAVALLRMGRRTTFVPWGT